MNEEQMIRYMTDTFTGVDVVAANGDSFFFYNPDPTIPPDHMFPFVTIVTSDFNDEFSNLNRPDVFRLNIGIGKQTFHTLFGTPNLPTGSDVTTESSATASNYDFTALDQVMPHPVYGRMFWVCVLNPSDATFATNVQPLLVEAYDMAVSKYIRKASQR